MFIAVVPLGNAVGTRLPVGHRVRTEGGRGQGAAEMVQLDHARHRASPGRPGPTPSGRPARRARPASRCAVVAVRLGGVAVDRRGLAVGSSPSVSSTRGRLRAAARPAVHPPRRPGVGDPDVRQVPAAQRLGHHRQVRVGDQPDARGERLRHGRCPLPYAASTSAPARCRSTARRRTAGAPAPARSPCRWPLRSWRRRPGPPRTARGRRRRSPRAPSRRR